MQIWIIRADDLGQADVATGLYDLQGQDVSDILGRPDLVTVQRTCSNGAGSILVWQAPLRDRRVGYTAAEGDGFILIVEKPATDGTFDNKFDPATDLCDGVLNASGADQRGFSVTGL